MRTMVNAASTVKLSPRLKVQDSGGTWRDLSSRIFAIAFDDSLDADSASITVQFRNHPDFVTALTGLDPLDQSSAYNLVSGSYNPLLGRYHAIKLEVSKDDGSNYYEVFRGYVGPGSVSVATDVSMDDTVTVEPVDLSFPYKEYHFYDSLIYKDADAVSIMSQIFADHGFNQSVTEIDAPAFHVEEIRTGETNIWAAQKALIEPTGYIYRIKWDSGAFEPCVYDPNRDNSSPDAVFSGTFSYRRLDVCETDVRTQIVIIYRDRNSGTIRYAQSESESARDKYGIPDGNSGRLHKTMWYAVQGTGGRYSMIDTPGEAKTLADYVLHDLKEPAPDIEVRLPYIHPGVEIHDYLSIIGNDYTAAMGVTGFYWSWSVDNQYGEMIIRGAVDRVIGQFGLWLMRDAHSPDVARELELMYLQGDGVRPPRPVQPECRSYWGMDSSTGRDVPVVICTVTPVNVWDLQDYLWRWQVVGEAEPEERVTREPRITIKGLPVGKEVHVNVCARDWSSTGG